MTRNSSGGGAIRPPSHRRGLAFAAVVAAAFLGLLAVSAQQALRPVAAVAVRPVVQTGAPAVDEGGSVGTRRHAGRGSRGGSGVTVQAPGWLEADPFYVPVSALADGVLDEVLALEGERVEKDEVVARLIDDDARLALARAEADLAVAEADLAAAETDWAYPVERERAVEVARGALGETEAELAQLPALISVEEANLVRLREELKRAEDALKRGAATDIEVIIMQKRADAQEAALEALKRREGILTARRDRLAAELRAAERAAELRVMEKRALDAARAAAAQARAARDEAALRLERMEIPAPISGFVQRRLKAPGDKVMLGADDAESAHVLHLYDPERIQVRVDVPLADAAHVFVGQRCEVVVEILPNEVFEGEVTRITHEADLQKNTLQVKVRVIDPSPLLKPEMLTRVKFLPGTRGETSEDEGEEVSGSAAVERVGAALLAARECVGDGTEGAFVWAVRQRRGDRGVAVRVPVEVVNESEGWVGVRGALAASDLLVAPAGAVTGTTRVRMVARDGAEEAGS
ncbi:MAG: efflux RND transporter periplasmic adaptor subunit [Planctomycetota bacterium]|nr:efflux RND transporter periplasmic adaptor subunit [Planctomycetota bacterium]